MSTNTKVDELEITPEMIKAGSEALQGFFISQIFDDEISADEVTRSVLRAALARRNPAQAPQPFGLRTQP